MVVVAAMLYGLAVALAVAVMYWVYLRVRATGQGFPWRVAALAWLPASVGMLALMYATFEG